MKSVPPYSSIPRYQIRRNLLPPKDPSLPPYTLVLDLDETLVHCSLDEPSDYDISFIINEGEEYIVYLSFRPYVFHFLERMSQFFELIVYTAGIRQYASTICELFNNDKPLIQQVIIISILMYRGFLCRDDCIYANGMYIKDLKSLNRDLVCNVLNYDVQSKTILLDNSPYTFAFDVNNGIPIESWYSDKKDKVVSFNNSIITHSCINTYHF